MTSIKLNNNIIVYLSKSENNEQQIIFKIKDAHNRFFEQSYDFETFEDLFEENISIEQFFEYLNQNNLQVIERQEENEILLKIIATSSKTIILKETNKNNNTVKINDLEGLNILKPLNKEIGKNEYLKIRGSSIKNNFINIIYLNKNTNKIYKTNYEFDKFKEFYKCLSNTNPTIEKGDNEKEIKLKIIYENEDLSIILKEITLINEDVINNLKEKYNEKMKKIKEEYNILYNKNKELKEKIEKEKIKNDEIVRIYLENRIKYEEAIQKDYDIQELSLNI